MNNFEFEEMSNDLNKHYDRNQELLESLYKQKEIIEAKIEYAEGIQYEIEQRWSAQS